MRFIECMLGATRRKAPRLAKQSEKSSLTTLGTSLKIGSMEGLHQSRGNGESRQSRHTLMNNDPDQNKNATPSGSEGGSPGSQEKAAREVAEKALGQAKEGVTAGVETFKKLEPHNRIYLVGLAVAFLFSVIFNVMSVDVKVEGVASDFFKGTMQNVSVTAFDCGANGKLAVLAALAGIGLWIWNNMAAKKEAWVPLALAGCAGFSALMFLVLMMRSGGSSAASGLGMKIDVDMTLLGFWIPFAGAIAATVVSVKRIMKPA
jgi:hypothetical protein